MGECLYAGKVKEVWSTDDPDILEFRYTNQISVFDQIIPSLIPKIKKSKKYEWDLFPNFYRLNDLILKSKLKKITVF